MAVSGDTLYDWAWLGRNISTLVVVVSLVTCGTALYLLAFGFRKLRNYVFDVLAWTLQSEKDERYAARRRVVQYAQNLIRDVLQNPDCKNCVIISHSLGSCIAYEAMMMEGTRMKAEMDAAQPTSTDLPKVTAIFTVGSPLDWIFYLFQIDRTFSHRYHRLFEDQRPSLATPPFWLGGKAGRTRIINIWSRFDPVSSRIFSPRKSVSERRDAIINLEAFPSGVPFPLSTHTSYYSDPFVMKQLYWAIMADAVPDGGTSGYPLQGPLRFFGPWLIFVGAAALLSALLTLLLSWELRWPLVACGLALAVPTVWSVLARSHYRRSRGDFLRR